MREPPLYILGIPLTDNAADASPLVVWEGSHRIMRDTFQEALSHAPHEMWPDVDLTDVYQAARRRVFETCRRVTLPGKVGEVVLLDPMLVHGIAPWEADEAGPRIVAYFRPQTDIGTWLNGAENWFPQA